MRVDAEPRHLDALLKFAARAYRRPLSQAERDDLLAYYHTLREKDGLTHEDAIRDSIVSVLMSPDFCYRIDLVDAAATRCQDRRRPAPQRPSVPLSGYALASRLSYFLWSSMPDEELLAHAAAGDLQKPDVLVAQARRMLKDDRARGLAPEFAGNWLDFRRFEEHNAVDRERFPSFTNELREAMFQEPIRFIEDVIRNDRSVLDLLYGNYTFVNPVLAKHYGMPEVTGDADTWVRVDDAEPVRPRRPAADVRLPDPERARPANQPGEARLLGGAPRARRDHSAAAAGRARTAARRGEAGSAAARQCWPNTARTRPAPPAMRASIPSAWRSKATARRREADQGSRRPPGRHHGGFPRRQPGRRLRGRAEPTSASTARTTSSTISAASCWPTLSAGRCMLSDEPAIERMQAKLTANGYRFTPLVETIVTSPQFLNKRSLDSQGQKGE